ncbi:sulfotransferase domain-containing protein [Aestuariibaculum sp. M13]|uniref:sulfotransferase domain-containing protein n=1 Tax=Aestuariibaculum sp. M13 TaxID=2967132 RepID=UPI002159CE76|nr:sulfotransferase domain-containing protein [Aestuariibaculum sp. M13]MCR8666370.1 sulfotransferase domain-containing protein [Aestuariibaculum sp. M13]
MQIFKKSKTIVHCCTQKTASQWFILFLSDIVAERNKKFKKLTFVDYRKSIIFKESIFKKPSYLLQKELYTTQRGGVSFEKLKKRFLYTNFYVGPNILKNLNAKYFRVFFILRDPRDLVVSWYYSAKYSHSLTEDIKRVRSYLKECSFEEGIKYSIDQMSEFGLFEGVRGWMQKSKNDDFFRIYLYEDFVEHYRDFCVNLISFLDLQTPNVSYDKIIDKHAYENYSNGRIKGNSDVKSHYRSAAINQWKTEFNSELIEYFEIKTNNLGQLYDLQKKEFKI